MAQNGLKMGYVKKELHLRVTPELHAALASEAERLGISINALAVTVLQVWRDEKEASDDA